MNKKGMPLFCAMDGVSDEMLLDALPPVMGAYEKKQKSRPLTGFFERPWVAAVISAAVALVVLTGIIWAGQKAAKDPSGLPGEIGGNPAASDGNVQTDKWPDYDNPPVPDDAKIIVSSGGYTIAPAEYIQWKQTWNADEGKFEEIRGDMQWGELMPELDSGGDDSPLMAEISNLPCIPYADDFNLTVSDRPLELQYASAYKEYQQSYQFAYGVALDLGLHTVDDLMAELSEGSYYILVVAYERGADIEGTNRHEGTMYEFVFRVDVWGGSDDKPNDLIEQPIVPIDVQVFVATKHDTILLRPYVSTATQYNEDLGIWSEVRENGLDHLQEKSRELPTVIYDESFEIYIKELDGTATPRYLYVYDENFEKIGTYRTSGEAFPWQPEELRMLSAGTYYVVLIFHQSGITIGDHKESGTYDYGFKLVVQDEAISETYEEETVYEPSFPDLAPSDSIDIELYVRSDVDAPQKLTPHVVYAYLYDDDAEQLIDIQGDGLNQRISELYDTLPIFTFDETIEWYLENKEDEASCQWYGTDLYDEHFNRVSDVEDIDPEELGPGKYYAVIGYYQAGREIVDYIGNVPEDDMMADVVTVYQEYGYYEYGFCIVIPEP